MSFLVSFLCSFSLLASMCSPQLGALSILKASQGGTGIGSATAGDVGKVLKVSDDDPFTFILDTDNTGSGGGTFPFDIKSNFGSTTFSSTTPYWARTGLFASSTSQFDRSTTTLATLTTLWFTGLSNSGLGVDANGQVYAAPTTTFSSGLTYSNGNVTNSGVTSITGTTNQITASASTGAVTLSLPNHVIFPGSYFASTGTTTNATSTSFGVTLINAIGSGGIDFHSSNGTQILQLGSGGGSNATFSGGVNIDGTTRLATSLTGLAYTASGVVSAVTNGTGGQILSMVDGVPGWVATTTFSTGLTYSAGAVTVNTSQNIATLSNLTTNGVVYTSGGTGALNVDSGALDVTRGGTGVTTFGGTNSLLYTTSADTLSSIAAGTNGFVLAVSGGVPTWVATTTLATISGTLSPSQLANSDFGNFTCAAGVCTIDNTSVTNGMLANSTISGIALGSNLANLSATDSTLTFSGTYNGGTARTIGINLANANTWTALQQFNAKASTTQISATVAYFGGTATTTIDSAGNIVIPTGASFTDTGTSDGCATWLSGVLNSTGVACGSGSGSASDKFATTSDTFGIYPNGAANTLLGVGTSSPKFTLTISSSTRAQLALTDASLTSNAWNFRSNAGNLMISTSSASTFATSSRSAIEIDTNGTLTLGKALTAVNGGTGNVTYATGDLLYASDASTLTRLPIGGASTCLTVSGGLPAWSTCASGGAFQYNGWATTSPFTGSIILYPLSPDSDVVIGSQSSTTAPFWWDESATTTYIGNGGNGDSLVSLGKDGNEWTFGVDDTDKSFRIASSTTLGTALTDIFSITKSLVITIGNTLASILNVIGVGRSYSFVVATTTPGNGVYPGLFIQATSTQWNGLGINFMVGTTSDYGIESPYLGAINGPITTNEWQSEFCTTAAGETTQVVADTIRGCGRYYYVEDANGAVDFAAAGGENYFRLRAGATGTSNVTGDGMGISMATAFLNAASSTPLMDVKFRQGTMENATSTINMQLRVGFQSTTGLSPDYAAANQVGCYFTASTTKANWIAVCRDTNETNIDTGIASSTVKTGNGGWFRGYIMIKGTTAYFQLISIKDGKKAEVTMTSNVPQTTLLNPTLSMAKTGVTSVQNELQFQWLRVWYKLANTH